MSINIAQCPQVYYTIHMKIVKGHKIYDNPVEAAHYKQFDVKKDWREAKTGDWVISDDGKVIQITKAQQGFFYTATGGFIKRSKKGMYIDKSKQPPTDPANIKTPIKQKEFARQYTIFFDINKAYSLVYGTDANKNWKARARIVFNKPDVQALIEQRIKGMFVELGIDDKYFLTNLKRIVEEGKKSSQLDALRDLRGYVENVLNSNQEKETLMRGLEGRIQDAEYVVAGEDNGEEDTQPDAEATEKPDTEDNAGEGNEDNIYGDNE